MGDVEHLEGSLPKSREIRAEWWCQTQWPKEWQCGSNRSSKICVQIGCQGCRFLAPVGCVLPGSWGLAVVEEIFDDWVSKKGSICGPISIFLSAGLFSLMRARMKANVPFGSKTVGIFNMVAVCLKDTLRTRCNACPYNMMGPGIEVDMDTGEEGEERRPHTAARSAASALGQTHKVPQITALYITYARVYRTYIHCPDSARSLGSILPYPTFLCRSYILGSLAFVPSVAVLTRTPEVSSLLSLIKSSCLPPHLRSLPTRALSSFVPQLNLKVCYNACPYNMVGPGIEVDMDTGEEGEERRPHTATDNAMEQTLSKRSRKGGFGGSAGRGTFLSEAAILDPTQGTLGGGSGQPPCKRTRLLTPDELVVGPQERITSSLTTETLPSSRAKPRRGLDKPFSWDNMKLGPCSKLPSQLTALIEACNEARHLGTDTQSCPCLAFLGLQWYEELGCLICMQHNKLIPGDYLWMHLSRSHPGKYPGTTREAVFKAALSHIVGCHPGIKNQSTADVKSSLPARLAAPIPLQLSDVLMRYKCPVPGCPQWTHQNKSRGAPEAEHKRHLKTHSAGEVDPLSQSPVIPQWTQRVDIGAGKSKCQESTGATHCFLLPPFTLPPSVLGAPPPLFPSADITAPSTQNWAESLGWEDYIATLACRAGSRSKAVAKLRDLVALPSKARIAKCMNEVTRALEQGLLLSNALNLTYMKDGAKWVASMHPSVCAQFSHNP
jgi:hypothetical protein